MVGEIRYLLKRRQKWLTDKKSMYYYGYNIIGEEEEKSILMKAKYFYEKAGILTLIRKAFIFVTFGINYAVFNRYFTVDGRNYRYFFNTYMLSGERVIEIPFTKEFLLKVENKDVLEIGDVLPHYFNLSHTVVDKYEKAPGVINTDVLNFVPDRKYDLIISISTIEHIGFDEPIKEFGNAKKALSKIIGLLSSKGIALITVPVGYNPEIDSILKNNEIAFTKRYFLKRISKLNLWKETTIDDALRYKYGSQYPFANSVAFLVFNNSKNKKD